MTPELQNAYDRGATDERESCAAFIESVRMADVLLSTGELSAHERRTVRALLPWLAALIRKMTR